MERRYFTLDEAVALLPRLTELLTTLRERRQAWLAREHGQQSRARTNGHTNGTAGRARAGSSSAGDDADVVAMNEIITTIQALGIEIKDLDMGLVDFYAWREGRVVYLCWRLGEPTVAWWHELDTGFAGRQPL